MTNLTISIEVDDEILQRLLAAGPVEWGHTGEKPDAEHVAEFAETLRKTREHFGTVGNANLEGVFLAGTNIVVAHTGVSPNSPTHARIMTVLWNAFLGAAIVESIDKAAA